MKEILVKIAKNLQDIDRNDMSRSERNIASELVDAGIGFFDETTDSGVNIGVFKLKKENLALSLKDEVEGAKNKLWPSEFSEHAQSEGWDVFDVNCEFLEISKLDENSPFNNDYEAMQWVLNRYISGCFVAARALSISLFRINSMT